MDQEADRYVNGELPEGFRLPKNATPQVRQPASWCDPPSMTLVVMQPIWLYDVHATQ